MKTDHKNVVIDHGNTTIKLAVFDAEKTLVDKKTFPTEDYAKVVSILNEWDAESAIYATTSKPNKDILKVIKRFKNHLNFNQQSPIPLKLDYDTVSTLGIDRVANAFGAYRLFPESNALIIDVGTCITYDFVTNEGIYQGGAISPGPRLRATSMNNYTARLPLIDSIVEAEVLGKSTQSSLESGIFRGILFEIDGYIDALNNQIDQLTIILTGGYTSLFANHVKNTIFADSNFTLKGLNEILLYHVKK